MGVFQSRTTKDVATAGGAAGIVLAILTFLGEAWPALALSADVQAAVTVLVTTVLIPLLSRVIARYKGRQSAEAGLDAAVLDSLALEAERAEQAAREARAADREGNALTPEQVQIVRDWCAQARKEIAAKRAATK
jgi:hypothetical protein